MVIIDTSVWIAFFKSSRSQEQPAVTHLLDEEKAMLVGVVLSELIQVARSHQK